MTDETLEAYIEQLTDAHRTPKVTVAWQGGEPTMMGLDFSKRGRNDPCPCDSGQKWKRCHGDAA